MADLKRGREIFTQRVEYPLPVKPGVKDYVFYFVEAKGYGLGAHNFMGQYYKNHIAKDASSFEQMFALLHAEISSGQLTQIRELVLVAHGNAAQLFLPVVNAAPGVDPVYNCLTEYSISQLQVDMKAGQFATMSQARKEVAARMLDDSWVTVRACNVGKSGKILYALYALFGGRANVYAPTQYMFFGDCAIGPDQRVTTKFGVYDFLVKQHFLATSEHTLQRQAAIITDLLDPESYSMPFVLASAQPDGGNAADLAAYSKLVGELNAFRLSADMRTRFQAQGFALSPGASVVRSARFTNIDVPQRAAWFILDRTVQSDGEKYDLVYEIHDQPGTGDQPTDTLEARARIASLVSSNASFPFQLFFNQDTDDDFKGIVVRLAGYADGGNLADPQSKDKFTAIESLLNAKRWTDGTIDLAFDINANLARMGLTVLPDPPPPIQSAASAKGTWTVGGAQPLVIRREATKTVEGFPAFSLTVYRVLTDAQRVRAEHEVITTEGRDPDAPGTELAAYLDRFTLDELDGLLAFLRATYRPAFAFYINHTQEAMQRRRDFNDWWKVHRVDEPIDAYSIPRPGEKDDLKAVAFPFDFNDNWRQVKTFSTYVTPVQTDLFAEDDLRAKLKIVGTWSCDSSVPNSPSTSRADARAAQLPGNERFFASKPNKTLFEPKPATPDSGCADFRTAITKWKELRDAGVEPDLEKQKLEELEVSGESYYKKIQETLEPFHLTLELSDLLFQTHIEPYVLLTEHLAKHVASEALADALETGAAVGELAPVFMIPFEMWMQAAEANLEGVNLSEELGELVAIRLWIYRMNDLTVTQVPFVGTQSINLGGPEAFDDAYKEVHARDYPYGDISYRYSPDDMKRGFVFAAPRFSAIGPQIVVQADKAVSERIAALGLDPCRLKALTDIGLLDLDKIRRRTIRGFGEAILNALHKV